MKGLEYDIKILLAWGECISGNEKITKWLMTNGYPELALFRYALRNEERSRDWLFNNGHKPLLALINGIEGKEDALDWLERHGYETLRDMALIGDGDVEAFEKLIAADQKVFAMLAKKMEFVKDAIEEAKTDFHKYSSSQS